MASGFNQLAGTQAPAPLVLTLRKLAISDLFDNNRDAHDARTQFLNWGLLTHGHFDFAADSRGYSNGAALEWFHDAWALRAGRFEVPQQWNGLALDHHPGQHHGDQVELQHDHLLGGARRARCGCWRFAAERVARLAEALANATANPAAIGGVPNLAGAPPAVRARRGPQCRAVVHGPVGRLRAAGAPRRRHRALLLRVDRQALLAGAVLPGAAWRHGDDQVELAWSSNGLSAAHRRFLAAGGSDFFLGAGQLQAGREATVEAYKSAALTRWLRLSLDLQHIGNPGYNRDCCPVRLAALRLHAEL